MKLLLRIVIIICCLPCMQSIHAQEEYNSMDDLLYDLSSREIEKPILFLSKQLNEIEQTSTKESFPDTTYVEMASLLSGAYIVNNNYFVADSILNHAINFFLDIREESDVLLSLYFSYGLLHYQIKNFNIANKYLSKAISCFRNHRNSETYANILSWLSVTDMELGNKDKALDEIEESICFIDSIQLESTKCGIFQRAGAIYASFEMLEKAKSYTLESYNLSNSTETISIHISSGIWLCVMHLNEGEFEEAIEIGRELLNLPLSEDEYADLYETLYSAFYFLRDIQETVKYASLYSDIIKKNVCSYYSSFSNILTENKWEQQSMGLKAVMGIIDKCKDSKEAAEICYNNSLFIKTLPYHYNSSFREAINSSESLKTQYSKIKELRSSIFSGVIEDVSHLTMLSNYFLELERELHMSFHNDTTINLSYSVKKWNDVQTALQDGECAIEIISYSGFEDIDPYLYGALILRPEFEAPEFVELCKFSELYNIYIAALKEYEIGINALYEKGNNTLYNLIWDKIEPYLENTKDIYISPILGLQYLSIGYIPCPNSTYLNELYNIHIVTSTENIINRDFATTDNLTDAFLFGGIDFGHLSSNVTPVDTFSLRGIIINDLLTRGGFNYLKGTSIEIDSIASIFNKDSKINTIVKKESEATEKAFRELDGNSPSVIHFSTHGFYLVGADNYANYFNQLTPYSLKDESMLRTGLLLADANISLRFPQYNWSLIDGVITAEEISTMDLSKTKVVVLSACDTALGITNEGIGGLPKAFKLAGVKKIIASLWRVPDTSTSILMTELYRNYLSGMDLNAALLEAQRHTSKYFKDPFYYAGFVVIN